MNARLVGATGLGALLLGAAAVWQASQSRVPLPTTIAAAPVDAPTTTPAAPQTSTVPAAPAAAPKATVAPSRELLLPDGTSVPTLNDAVDAAPLARYWGPFPWSPIVGVRSGAGVDWYEHADGSFSTTQMVWRSDLGRMAAMTRVAHPGPQPAAAAPARSN